MAAFGLSLGVMFLADYFLGRFSALEGAWYAELNKPLFAPNPVVYDIGFIAALGFAVICCTFSTVNPALRKTLILWLCAAGLTVLWGAVLFVWVSPYGALGISLAILIALAVLLHYYAKHTRELWLALIPALGWYAYIFVFNYAICMMN